MPYDPRPGSSRTNLDPALRELLSYLRDTFRDAASRIDRYLGDGRDLRDGRDARDSRDFDRGDRPSRGDRGFDRPAFREHEAPPAHHGAGAGGGGGNIRYPLEALREEARQISADAPEMDPATLRLRIEAVTAETRALQNRATDPEDQDIAAKILRALTAIVSEHRPGHVYGLARHHQADWDEVGRRARREIADTERQGDR